jgi:hypothetical protein
MERREDQRRYDLVLHIAISVFSRDLYFLYFRAHSLEDEGGGKDGPMVLYFDVVPDFVNVTRSEMKPSEFYRWFCVVRLEYDGQVCFSDFSFFRLFFSMLIFEVINADQIVETSTKIRMLKLEEKELTLKIEDLNKDITDVGLEAAGILLFP